MGKPSNIIQAGKSQRFQYRGAEVPNAITITKTTPGPASHFRVRGGVNGWTLYGEVKGGTKVQLEINWPTGEGTVYCDSGSEIEVAGDGIYPV